jgi:hypothetical protein
VPFEKRFDKIPSGVVTFEKRLDRIPSRRGVPAGRGVSLDGLPYETAPVADRRYGLQSRARAVKSPG